MSKRDINRQAYDMAWTGPLTSIYFIRMLDYIKIGKSNSPEKRLMALQVGCPVNLELVATIPNVPKYWETILQDYFKDYRTRGEWFSMTMHKGCLSFYHIDEQRLLFCLKQKVRISSITANNVRWHL